MGTGPTITVILPLVVLAVGVILLLWGLIGRRVGGQRVCRACGYDVGGIARGVEACPECGASLQTSRAIVTGARKRRPIIASLGLLLAVLGGSAVVVLGAPGAFRAQPFWLLKQEVAAQGKIAEPAMSELESRHRRGQLSATQVSELVDALLTSRGKAGATWWPSAGRFMVAALGAGEADAAQAAKFYTLGVGVSTKSRTRVRQGSPTTISVDLSDKGIMGGGVNAAFRARFDVRELRITFSQPGKPPTTVTVSSPNTPSLGLNGGVQVGANVDAVIDVPPGEYDVEIFAESELRATGLKDPITFKTTSPSQKVTVLPHDAELVARMTAAEHPDIAARLRSALRPLALRIEGANLTAGIEDGGCPVAVVGSLVAEQRDGAGKATRTRLMWVTIPRHHGGSVSQYVREQGPVPEGLVRPGTVRMIIVPEPERAERLEGIDRVWTDEIDLGEMAVE